MTLVDDEGTGRYRIVVDAAPARRRLFEARVPTDATDAELEHFFSEVRRHYRQRRENEITRNERKPP